jgi:hypothetical protein
VTTRKTAGRPTLLDDTVHRRIVDACRAGAYFEDACRAAGIHPQTAHKWMGEYSERPGKYQKRFIAFRDAVEQARASARLESVVQIRIAGQNGDWRAAAWYLERTEPGKWGSTQRLQIKGDAESPLEVRVTHTDVEAARSARDQMAKLGLKASSDDQPSRDSS